jgi:hypothetical protein
MTFRRQNPDSLPLPWPLRISSVMGVYKPLSVQHLDMLFQFLDRPPRVSVCGDQEAIHTSAQVPFYQARMEHVEHRPKVLFVFIPFGE